MHYQTFGNHSCSGAVYFYWVLRERCPYSGLFWSTSSHIQTEYGEILCMSVRMPENADQNKSEHGHFLHSGDVEVSFFSSYRLSRHSSFCTFPLSNHSLRILSDGVAYHHPWINWWSTDVTGFPFIDVARFITDVALSSDILFEIKSIFPTQRMEWFCGFFKGLT